MKKLCPKVLIGPQMPYPELQERLWKGEVLSISLAIEVLSASIPSQRAVECLEDQMACGYTHILATNNPDHPDLLGVDIIDDSGRPTL